ncbi:MAG: hypothetical protein EZS28_005813 [Streblomastix strix]|uniref:Uncharacterized protein n=1 Tax=Streblomastix strix TaxID=222440 RepID=A0A5J4WWH8_9EUKA|nr:MAG: hypothetical protein EZS28_005813 [Streblomastix strix]
MEGRNHYIHIITFLRSQQQTLPSAIIHCRVHNKPIVLFSQTFSADLSEFSSQEALSFFETIPSSSLVDVIWIATQAIPPPQSLQFQDICARLFGTMSRIKYTHNTRITILSPLNEKPSPQAERSIFQWVQLLDCFYVRDYQ